MITPPVMTNATSQTAAQAGVRNRGADEDQGRSFGAALERSRANNGNRADATPKDGAQDVATIDRKPVRKPGADEDTKKEDALPADPNLAFLATAHTPLHALTLAGRSAQQQQGEGAADATAATAPAGTAADIPLDPALQTAAAKVLGADAAVADASAAPETAVASKDAAAKPATPALSAAPLQDNAAPATSLHELARAAIAAQTMSVGIAKPASAPAGSPVGTAATGRGAAARTPVSATTAEQLASAAQQPEAADDAQAKAAPIAAVAAATASDTDAQPPVAPIALQQPAAIATASSDGTNDTAATRAPVHTIAPEVGGDKWAPALGQQLARMSTSGNHTAELNLNPAGLGPLKVTLSMGDNQAQAMFVSAHESVRKAIEAALPQLRNSLSEQGITLGQTSVGAENRQPFGNDAAFAQQQSQQQQQNAARQQAASPYPGAGRTTASAPVAPLAVVRAGASSNAAGVDTFA
ncbi:MULTISPECIES: flagellar hook-length control protein FliK [unclassified Variovorax]|uniref:flagellar hook-length control protein FliK n=1 Tax=unclassified Variovorax TaxID=663243 RepID=UPI003F486BF2